MAALPSHVRSERRAKPAASHLSVKRRSAWREWICCNGTDWSATGAGLGNCRLADLSLLLLSLAVAGVGAASLPLDDHEVFVAQTAQEMLQRGDWLVPYFNGEPRLTKPPLSYWLTAFISWASGAGHVLPEHARAVSVLAGTGLCALTLFAGRLLFPLQRGVGMTGALFLLSSAGFFTYTHDGRSDMLYSFLCMAGVTAFLSGWSRRARAESAGPAPYLMWAWFALATLAKGPHMPALFLTACTLFAGYARIPWRQWNELFRPLPGLVLFFLIALPWWWLLRNAVGADTLAASQLSGSLLTGHGKQVFTPYYFYRALPLIAPWIVPLLAGLACVGRHRPAPETALLLLLAFCPAIALGFGSQQRPLYILPALPWLFLLLAKCTAAPAGSPKARLLSWGLLAQWLLVLAAGGWLWFRAEAGARAEIPGVPLLIGGIAWLGYLAWRLRPNPGISPGLAGTAVMLCLAYVLGGPTPLVWGKERYARPQLAEGLRQAAAAGIPIVSLGDFSEVYVYYANRHIETVSVLSELGQHLARHGELAVIAKPDSAMQFPPEWHAETLGSMSATPDSRVLLLAHRPG